MPACPSETCLRGLVIVTFDAKNEAEGWPGETLYVSRIWENTTAMTLPLGLNPQDGIKEANDKSLKSEKKDKIGIDEKGFEASDKSLKCEQAVNKSDKKRTDTGVAKPMKMLETLDSLIVKERTEVLEVITGIDMNIQFDIYSSTGALRTEVLEVITGIDMNIQFDIYSSTGALLFHAYEKSSCVTRFFLRSRRAFTMHIVDAGGKAGYVRQTCGGSLKFDVYDGLDRLKIAGPSYCGFDCCTCCFPEKKFKISRLAADQEKHLNPYTFPLV
ncbi:unnamed protein product [Strongylus vulgaris]|uniref:Phospholipid scramblase n=1 Tax=Strongylus vulgaris TaxID=40348 RepID=A0A3P7LDI0_STRVU|nr:unnamed protein product [Strongylus vulgaris]